MTYLFFDIECANSFGGIGKMCSFGYVLCNHDFSVIETNDFLINPDAPFDWYLFKKNSKCHLAYRKEEYLRHEKFSHFYSKICTLLTSPDRLVFGFGCSNDISTIESECIRYGLNPIDFSCYDISKILGQYYQTSGSLSSFVQLLNINQTGLEFHDSKADAIFTMKVTERLAADMDKPVNQILSGYQPASGIHAYSEKIKKLYVKYLERSSAPKNKTRRKIRVEKVPDNFDYKKELLLELELQKQQKNKLQ